MRLYRHTGNIKASLFILGVILVIGLLAYTQKLVAELRNDNREIVRLYAGLIANVVQDDNDLNLDYIFENIIQKVKFPLIQTDTDHFPQMWKNLPENIKTEKEIIKFMRTIDKDNQPIPLNYKDANVGEITIGYLHYGDSRIVHKLKIWSYIEIVAIGLFIFLGFIGFSFIRNNEKKHNIPPQPSCGGLPDSMFQESTQMQNKSRKHFKCKEPMQKSTNARRSLATSAISW